MPNSEGWHRVDDVVFFDVVTSPDLESMKWLRREADRTGLSVERVATALDQASREADSYLAVRLAVPLDTTAGVPQPLRAFVCDMARYHLTAGLGMQVPEDVEARYKAALAWLKDVAKGAAEIVVPTPPDAPEPQPPETGVEFAPGCHDRFF